MTQLRDRAAARLQEAGTRRVKADFDAVIMLHMGHYPMLERPEEFNRLLASIIAEILR